MSLKAAVTLFAWSALLAVLVLVLVAKPLDALADYHDQLQHMTQLKQ